MGLIGLTVVLKQQMPERIPASLEMGHRSALSENKECLQVYLELLSLEIMQA